jgi:predicted MFS family arabinose efflux permease
VASALCLRGVGEVPATPAPAPVQSSSSSNLPTRFRAAWREVTAGLALIGTHPTLRALAVLEALLALAMGLAGTSYMIYVSRDLAIPTGQLGLIFAVGGLGAIVGARLAASSARRLGLGWPMTAGLAAMAAGAVCIPLAAGAGTLAIALLVAHQLVGDGGHTLYAVHDRTLRQTEVAPQLLSRADAGIRFVGQLATLAGAMAGGVMGNALGARWTLALCAGVASIGAAYAAWRLRSLRSQRGTPGAREAGSTPVPPAQRGGAGERGAGPAG